jgi:hypothetical protein
MRKSLFVYLLLWPFLFASIDHSVPAISDSLAKAPWPSPVAAAIDYTDVDDRIELAPLPPFLPFFDSTSLNMEPHYGLRHGCSSIIDPASQPRIFTRNRTLLI